MALPLFDTVLSGLTFSSAPVGNTLSLALGARTLVLFSLTQSLTFNGIAALNGNVDGMFVCLANVTNAAGIIASFAHDGVAAGNSFRLWNAGLATVNGGAGIGAVSYVYSASLSHWIMVGKTS